MISSRRDIGDRKSLTHFGSLCYAYHFLVFDEQHTVFCVKGVAVIPLTEIRARAVLAKLALSHTHIERPDATENAFSDAVDSSLPAVEGESSTASSPKVKFAAEDQVKMMTPRATEGFDLPDDDDDSPPSPASVASTPSSEYSVNTGNIAKVLAEKLSFWSRLSTRPQIDPKNFGHEGGKVDAVVETETDEVEPPAPVSLETLMQDGTQGPSEVIEEILSSTAPPPSTMAEKHNEMEDKIIRDCVREFTRGGMFFAYTFGTDNVLASGS